MSPTERPRSAAALIIGNELLTGKTEDANLTVLARLLFRLGVTLERAIFCRDEVEVIAAELDALRLKHDFVFTSGGVGPTHDDVTLQAIAKLFGCPLVRSRVIEKLMSEHYQSRLSPRHLRMADLPEGAELLLSNTSSWPLVKLENIFVLPGLPNIFQQKMAGLAEALGQDVPFLSRGVSTLCDEGEVGDLLERLSVDHPEVAIGSYPRWNDRQVSVLITFDSRSKAAVERAVDDLLAHLPADKVVDDNCARSVGG